jgi:hypothetical protein
MSRIAALDYEIAQEQVSAFGRLGRALETALAALAEYERDNGERNATRARLVAERATPCGALSSSARRSDCATHGRCFATIACPPRCITGWVFFAGAEAPVSEYAA